MRGYPPANFVFLLSLLILLVHLIAREESIKMEEKEILAQERINCSYVIIEIIIGAMQYNWKIMMDQIKVAFKK